MKAVPVLHHDDPPCTKRLISGHCYSCGLTPDMQSTAIYYYCPKCNVKLRGMRCPKCEKSFEKAG